MSKLESYRRKRDFSKTAEPAEEDRVAGVKLSNPDRVLYPEQGATKLVLAQYYESISEWIMPWISRRPLSLVRCPQGREKECFFQKHPAQSLAREVPRIPIEEKSGRDDYVYVEDISHVVALVQAGTLEFHVWGSRVDDLEHPDIIVFDLDPGGNVQWSQMTGVARSLRDRLAQLGLESFLRTTGGKGLHLVVPLVPEADWEVVKDFSRAVAEAHARDDPQHLTSNMAKSKRSGRVFIDYLRNGRGATAIASYSTRARPGAPVAVPIRWDELNAAMLPDRYNLDNIRRRIAALKQDPWDGFDEARQPLDKTILKKAGAL